MKRLNPVPSDLEIAQAAELKPILDIAASLGLAPDDLDLYGKYKAKVHLDVLEKFADRPQGKYVDVTAITPTPLGEGKTTTTDRLDAGPGRAGQERRVRHPPAIAGAHLRHQGRRCRRRLLPDRADGGLQPAPDRRHPRHHCGARSDRGGRRRPHASRVRHRSPDHVRPAVPAGQDRQAHLLARHAAPREEAGHRQDRSRAIHAGRARPFRHAQHRSQRHHLEPGDRHQRPLPAQDRDRPGAGREGPHAHHRLRHHRRLGADGHPGPHDGPGGSARAHRPCGHRHQQGGRGGHGGRPGRAPARPPS